MNIDIKKLKSVLLVNQTELAKMLDTRPATISAWELGKSKPKSKNARAIKELCEKNGLNFYDFVIENE